MKIGLIMGISIGAIAAGYMIEHGKCIKKAVKKSEKMVRRKIMDIMDM